jgi:eukaryotic-like serine/threonine-protein kinase
VNATLGCDDLLADRYALGDVIGRGRSAVHEARDTRLGRDVAVKRVALVTWPDEVDDVHSRALREARAAARMTSPHVVAVYDVVEERDAVWLVMELVRAPSLEALVRERGPVPAGLAACIGLGVLDALTAAHRVDVVHRDVKPANVLVGTGDGTVDGCPGVTVKLADFGVAALRDESGLTQPGLVIGSPSYMAPEQAAAGAVGPAADLWALGALLYFAQEGMPPFAGDTALATASAVVHGEPRAMRRPGPLAPLIERLLVKDPAARPDAAAVRAALRDVSAGVAAGGATTRMASVVDPTLATAAGAVPATATVATRPVRPRRRRGRSVLAAAAVAAVLGGLGTQLLGGDDRTPGSDPAEAEPAADPAAGVVAPAAGAPAPATQVRDAGASADPGTEGTTPADTPAADPGPAAGAPATVPSTPSTTAAPTTTTPPEPEVTVPVTEPEPPATTVPPGGDDSEEDD